MAKHSARPAINGRQPRSQPAIAVGVAALFAAGCFALFVMMAGEVYNGAPTKVATSDAACREIVTDDDTVQVCDVFVGQRELVDHVDEDIVAGDEIDLYRRVDGTTTQARSVWETGVFALVFLALAGGAGYFALDAGGLNPISMAALAGYRLRPR